MYIKSNVEFSLLRLLSICTAVYRLTTINYSLQVNLFCTITHTEFFHLKNNFVFQVCLFHFHRTKHILKTYFFRVRCIEGWSLKYLPKKFFVSRFATIRSERFSREMAAKVEFSYILGTFSRQRLTLMITTQLLKHTYARA